MKYYLLTFNQDWADEHNVPALACFTEEQYQQWLERPSGKLNKNYEQELEEWYNTNKVEYRSIHNSPQKVSSYINAYLGNGGDCFGESFSDLYLMKEFVADDIVKVLEVDQLFFDYFHKAELDDLSLCNIFNEDITDWYDEDED